MLYLHIPFCKQACSYCNFHFSTSSRGRDELLLALHQEIRLRKEEIQRAGTETIYLGGGTPSLLTERELADIFRVLAEVSDFDYQSSKVGKEHSKNANGPTDKREITLEANPDDLTEATVEILAASPVNRLSIGLQSFQEKDLRYMNRAHSAKESTLAMQRVLKAGFTDLSVDLIYGSPTTSDADWDDNISRVLDFGVGHVSAYALTVEEKTALAHRIKTGQLPAPDEDRFARQFDRLVERLTLAGFEHYEISNFAKPGQYSRHNTGYWQGKPYVGLGPSAHGFNGFDQRNWNIANNALYTRLLTGATSIPAGLTETEQLSPTDRYNEFVMTGLRTQWGVRRTDLASKFGTSLAEYFSTTVREEQLLCYFDSQKIESEGRYQLNQSGKRLADGIAAALFR
ncbi:coproporphyrinogen III oxidase [Lewinellaceae bacterium SD302]|nr:coproporphyrinogen III oxidase [Lewinellaceae bacterium SD302]